MWRLLLEYLLQVVAVIEVCGAVVALALCIWCRRCLSPSAASRRVSTPPRTKKSICAPVSYMARVCRADKFLEGLPVCVRPACDAAH